MTNMQIFLIIFGITCLISGIIFCALIVANCSAIQRQIDELSNSIEKRSRIR